MDNDNLLMPSDKPIRSDAVRNRQKLMTIARKLFNEHGAREVTMSQIAQEAHVGKGTLYRHFSDKAALCLSMLDEDMRNFQQNTLLHLRNSKNPTQTLHWFLREAVNYVDDHLALLIETTQHGDTPYLEHPAHMWFRQTILTLLQRINPDIDHQFITDTLYIMIDVRAIRFLKVGRNYDRERVITGVIDLADTLIA